MALLVPDEVMLHFSIVKININQQYVIGFVSLEFCPRLKESNYRFNSLRGYFCQVSCSSWQWPTNESS